MCTFTPDSLSPDGINEKPREDLISRKWLMEVINEGWMKFDTEEDMNRIIHLIRDIAPSVEQPGQEETEAFDFGAKEVFVDG